MRCGSFTANGEIFCVLQHSCCITPENLVQACPKFSGFSYAHAQKGEKKKSCAVVTSLQKKNYIKKKQQLMQSQRIADIFSMFKNASRYNTAKPTDIHRLDPAEVSKVIGLFLLPVLPIQKTHNNNRQNDQSDFFL